MITAASSSAVRWKFARRESAPSNVKVGSNGLVKASLHTRIREVKTWVCPAKCTDKKLGHARDVEIKFIAVVANAVDVLKINAVKVKTDPTSGCFKISKAGKPIIAAAIILVFQFLN